MTEAETLAALRKVASAFKRTRAALNGEHTGPDLDRKMAAHEKAMLAAHAALIDLALADEKETA